MAGEQYYSIFTEQGLALLRESIQNGTKLGIDSMSFGDGGGSLPKPDASFKALIHEVYRTQLNKLAPDPNNKNWLQAETTISSAIGGFNIRELGLWAGNILVAYSNYPPTYKPSPSDGTARIMTFRMILQIDNTANFELKIDADIVMATIRTVEEAKQAAIDYANETKVHYVNSIEELLNVEKIAGRVVNVKSYYAPNLALAIPYSGGGEFIYDPSQTDKNDGGSIINGWLRKDLTVVTPEMFGVKTGESCSDKFLNMLNLSKTGHLQVQLKKNEEYIFEKTCFAKDSKGVTLIGNGATVKIGSSIKSEVDLTAIAIAFKEDVGANLNVSDMTFDGINSFYNPWELFTQGKAWYTIIGLDVSNAKNIIVQNVKQKNIIGYGMRFFGFKNVKISNFKTEDVGGHNGLWGNDSYGDSLYFGWREGVTNIILENVDLNGVEVEDKYSGMYYSPRSRIGITIENLSEKLDQETNFSLNNVRCRKYQRFFHSEANKGNINVECKNIDVMADIMFLSSEAVMDGVKGAGYLLVDNSTFKLYNRDYNGTGGMNWGFKAKFTNSEIDLINAKLDVGALSHKNDNFYSEYYNCTIDNIQSLLANTGDFRAYDSTFNFLESKFDYYYYSSKAYYQRCTLNNANNTTIKFNNDLDNTLPALVDCAVNNLNFKSACYKNIPSRINWQSALPNSTIENNISSYASLIVDNQTVNVPRSIFNVQIKPGLEYSYKYGALANDQKISFLENPQFYYQMYGRKIYILVASRMNQKGHEWQILNSYGNGGYLLKYEWDSLNKKYNFKSQSIVGVNQASAGLALSFDTENNTLQKASGNSTYVSGYGLIYLDPTTALEFISYQTPTAIEATTIAANSIFTSTIVCTGIGLATEISAIYDNKLKNLTLSTELLDMNTVRVTFTNATTSPIDLMAGNLMLKIN